MRLTWMSVWWVNPSNHSFLLLHLRTSAITSPNILLLIVNPEQVHSSFISDTDSNSYEPNPSVEGFFAEYEYWGEMHTVYTNQRPHLTQFLEKYSERFDFDIFTAAMACYADPVLNTLDPEQKFFSKRYYRDSCPEWHNYAKDLEVCLAGSDYYQSMGRIVLVDNSTRSFVQPSNCILVPSWYDDPEDDLFKKTLPDLLEELDEAGDVRDGVSKWMECRYPDELARVRDRQRERVYIIYILYL